MICIYFVLYTYRKEVLGEKEKPNVYRKKMTSNKVYVYIYIYAHRQKKRRHHDKRFN